MALSEVRRPAFSLRPVESVSVTDDVYHVDQLSEADFEALVAPSDDDGVAFDGLDAGDIVVFTEYYRVEAV